MTGFAKEPIPESSSDCGEWKNDLAVVYSEASPYGQAFPDLEDM